MNKNLHIKYFCICLICLSLGLFQSCSNNISSNSVSQTILKPESLDNTNAVENTSRNIEITSAVQNYWKASLEGNQENLSKYTQPAPDDFWHVYPPEDNANKSEDFNSAYNEGNSQMGHGGISITERENSFWMVKYLSEQIKKGQAELLKTRIIRSNEKEAIVQYYYRKDSRIYRKDNSNDGWISELFLLYKENSDWKIFTITNSLDLAKNNRTFGFEPK